MKKNILIALLWLTASVAMAQTVIDGVVTDSIGTGVDAYITFAAKGGVIGFADTDAKGRYKATLKSDADSLVITAAGLALGQMVKVVANRSQTVNFRMKAQGLALKEVKVRAQKITESGDTLKYLVAAYQQQGDRVIGDVLKKMPGIEVEKSGRIKFNGKTISKFYVEDMDLLQGRYGIATNNINAKDVAQVQVLQNHQPVRALQGKTLTDDVAINLKLKNAAKGTVAVNTMLGGGWENPTPTGNGKFVVDSNYSTPSPTGEGRGGVAALFSAEVVGMYFAKTRQNMSLYKGNNSGDDVSGELQSHYSSINSVGLYPFCPMGVVMPSGSGLPMKRTFDNRSHIVAINHLEKLDSVKEITFNAAFYHDLVRREGTSQSDIFLAEDTRLLTSETLISQTTTNNLSTNLRYCKNAANGFIANVVKVDAGWDNDDVESLSLTLPSREGTTIEKVQQHFNRPTLAVSNTFNTIQTFGKRTLDLHFSAGYAQRPNTLSVKLDTLINNSPLPTGEGSGERLQDISSQNIAANFHTNFSWKFGEFTLSYGIVADASLHGIITDLKSPTLDLPLREGISDNQSLPLNASLSALPRDPFGVEGGAGEGLCQNDLWYNTYTLRLAQNYRWERGRWRLNLGCPIELYAQSLTNKNSPSPSRERAGVRVLLIPTFSASYYYRDWSGSINTGYQRTVGDPGGIYDGYIMSNYRSFQRSYVEQMSETDRVTCGANLGYRSAINAFFFNVAANYTHTRDNQTYGYDYQGATSVVQAINHATTADSYSLRGEVNKGFDWLQSSVRAFGGYSHSQSERLVGGHLYGFQSHGYSVGGGGTITPLPWLNFVVSSGYSWSRSELSAGTAQTVRNATQRLKLNVFITKGLTLTATAEDNYNNMTATQRHAWFGDIGAKYQFKHADLELECNNIFNQKTYTQTRYNGLDIHTATSHLRPFNVLAKVRFKLL